VSAIPQIAALSPAALAAAIAQALGHGRERNSNGTWRTFCPAHNDESGDNPSLDVSVKNGRVLLYCQTRHCPQNAIIAELKARGLWPDRPERRRLTLAEFSEKKKLPVDFLLANGVTEVESYGVPALHFRYYLEDGSPAPRYRVRTALDGERKLFWDRVGKGKGNIAPYGLERLPEARKRGLIALVEGESDALTCWLHDYPALGFPGATTVPKLLTPDVLNGISKLIVSQEPGDAGKKFRDDILAKLDIFNWAGKVRIVHWAAGLKDPNELHRADPEAFNQKFAEMVTAAELVDLSDRLPRPFIDADAYLSNTTAAAWEALLAANHTSPPRLYLYNGLLTRLERDDDAVVLREMTEPIMRNEITNITIWLKRQQTEPADPTKHQIENILATENPGLPHLRRVTRVPIFAPDGTLLNTPGFHDGILYVPERDLVVRPVSAKPNSDELAEALKWIEEMLCEFPFVSDADRAHAIALLLLPFLREMIKGPTPIHGVEAPQPRSGKGLLFENLLAVGIGRSYAHYGPPNQVDAELKKEITAALRDGNLAIVFDNVKSIVQSPELASATTKPFWTGRILGISADLRVDPLMVIWVIAGNNLSFTSEIQGRTIRIKIDAKTDKPEDRTFSKNLDIWVRDEHRGDLIWSVLTVIQYWISQGMPKPSVTLLGKFEEWTRVVGGVLETGGIPGFLSVRPSDNQSARDRNAAAWSELVTKWWEQYGGAEVKVSELFTIALTVEDFYLGKADATEKAQRLSFGKSLNGHEGYVIATMELEPKEGEQDRGLFSSSPLPAKLTITYTGTTRKRGGWKLIESEKKETE
jgi:hypothetical protein